jgi:hypothetical protein
MTHCASSFKLATSEAVRKPSSRSKAGPSVILDAGGVSTSPGSSTPLHLTRKRPVRGKTHDGVVLQSPAFREVLEDRLRGAVAEQDFRFAERPTDGRFRTQVAPAIGESVRCWHARQPGGEKWTRECCVDRANWPSEAGLARSNSACRGPPLLASYSSRPIGGRLDLQSAMDRQCRDTSSSPHSPWQTTAAL